MSEIAPWHQVQASLDTFDRHVVAHAVAQVLDAWLPADGRLGTGYRARQAGISRVRRAVVRSAGPWYRICAVAVGGERLGGWCWCHSFCRQAGKAPRDVVVSDGAAGVADEVARIHAYLCALDRHFEGPTADDVEVLIDVVVEHSESHDAWYGLLANAAVWLAQARGVSLSAKQQARVSTIVREHCTSWCSPSDPGALARAVVDVVGPFDVPRDPRGELLAAVRAAPDEDAPYLVLGDWLQSIGDPRGELIALHARRHELDPGTLAASQAALLAAHPELCPDLGSPRSAVTWHLGFWRSLRLEYSRTTLGRAGREKHARALLACESARCLRQLHAAFDVRGTLLSALAPVALTLDTLQLASLTADEDQVPWLNRLVRLRRLHIWEAHLDAPGLEAVAGLPLTHLDLVQPDRDAAAFIPSLWNHPTLIHLGLGELSAHAVFELSAIPHLESLDLSGWYVGDETVDNLLLDPIAPRLTVLDIGESDLTEAIAQPLENARALVELRAGDNPELGDAFVRVAATLPNLARLELSHNPVTDAGVAALVDCNLTHLSLLGTRVTGASVPLLAELTRLEVLDLRRTGVRLAELAPLATLPHLRHVGLRKADAAEASARYGWQTNGPELFSW